MIHKTIHFVLSLSLVVTSTARAEESPSSFKKEEVVALNTIKESHQFAHEILAKKNLGTVLAREAKRMLAQKVFKMPVFKLQNGMLQFVFENQGYALRHVKGSQYLLNGRPIDIESTAWNSQFDSSSSGNILIESVLPSAHAVLPLVAYAIIMGVVFILASGCIASSIGSTQHSIQWGKRVKVNMREFNLAVDKLRDAYKAIGCGANADAIGAPVDLFGFFHDYCGQLQTSISENRPTINGIRQFRRQLTDDEKTLRYVDGIKDAALERAYSQHKGTSLSEADRAIVDSFVADPDFMLGCVHGAFQESPALPSEGTSSTPAAQ